MSRNHCPGSVCAIQNTTGQKDHSNNQTYNDDYAQSIAFGLFSVIARNDGAQQMVDVAAMNLLYNKLHAIL